VSGGVSASVDRPAYPAYPVAPARTAGIDLFEALTLRQSAPSTFHGVGLVHTGGDRLYGGELVAQTLRACGATAPDDQQVHSLHSYYLRPAVANEPFEVTVEHVRDGRSFTIRSATLRQRGRDVCAMMASFHSDEPGMDATIPSSPQPPEPGEDAGLQPVQPGERETPGPHVWDTLRLVPIPGDQFGDASVPDAVRQRAWVRLATSAPPASDRLARAWLLTYLTDIFPLNASGHAVRSTTEISVGASLDHAVWFHRDAPVDGWLLFELRAMSLSNARGTVLATLHTADGRQLASLAQETLVRPAR